MISALLRNTEPTSGKIVIDGVDVHTIGLSLLRSSLSVISQDAVLLAGTIRYNLDPFRQYDDAWLQKCLSRVKLVDSERPAGTQETVSTSENNITEPDSGIGPELEKQKTAHSVRVTGGLSLDFEVKESGANISQGQRSLISMARALVRRSKIVIMDEATASIDGRADAQIQEMLSEVLGDATVLTVAHRLDTIVATCDRVVVMESGQVAEFDGIPELFARKDSIFRSLCDASKITVGGARR